MENKFSLLKLILRPNLHLIAASLGAQVGVSLVNAAAPYFTKLKLDQLQNSFTSLGPLMDLSPFVVFSSILVAAASLEIVRLGIFDRLSMILSSRLKSNSRAAFVNIFWDKLSHIDVGFFENRANMRIVGMASGSYALVQDVVAIAQSITRSGILLITVFPILALVDWRLLAISIISALIQAYFARIQVAKQALGNLELEKVKQDFWKVDRLITSDLPQIRIMGATEELKHQYAKAVSHLDSSTLKIDISVENLRSLQSFVSEGSSIALNLLVGFWVLNGTLSLGTFTMVVSYSLQINRVFRDILDNSRNWQELDLRLEQLRFFFCLKARLKSSNKPLKSLANPVNITLRAVSTYYPDYSDEERRFVSMLVEKMTRLSKHAAMSYYRSSAEDYQSLIAQKVHPYNVVNAISMSLNRGQLVALVGPNGSGKTTLTRLIMHSLETTSGAITIDKVPVWHYDPDIYLQQFALVQQFPFLLNNFSLRDNLTLGISPKPQDQVIWDVLTDVGLQKSVDSAPNKLDTLLGDGFELSGGQRQLLVIARVLLQNRPFVIMDESTSQLDADHEATVLKLLRTKLSNSAILFITHRLSTARRADKVYCLEGGVITQSGTHKDLISQEGLYSRYWRLQTQDQ